MKLTRRQVLAATAAVPVIGALGAGATAWSWWDRPAGADLKALSQDEFDFVQALAEGWMPRGGTPELSGADANIGYFFDDIVAAMHPQTAKEMRLLLHGLDHLPVPRRGRTFTSLSVDTRSACIENWLDHPLFLVRDAASATMVMVGIGWTTHPDVVKVIRPMFPCGYGR